MEETKEEIIEEKTDAEKRMEEYEALKVANDKVDSELLRREQLRAKIAMGGKSDAGQVEVEKEDTPEEKAEKFSKGEVDILAK